uniref:UBC core domain-containing protein n=1 Tax=Rattus norvegicus TaxID=10116 RepID=A0ABK0LJE7_RAT
MKELQDIARLSDRFISVELVNENLFDWNVKLHQVDKDSVLWQDMKETNTEFILLNLTFPDNFPFSPPFMRVLSPRLENGYVLDGGAICMELLTPRGWSSAYTVEAVMRQFAASLVKGQLSLLRNASCCPDVDSPDVGQHRRLLLADFSMRKQPALRARKGIWRDGRLLVIPEEQARRGRDPWNLSPQHMAPTRSPTQKVFP